MNKLTMAHECAMKLVGNPTTPLKTMEAIVDVSWKYADAMQAEADKRIKSEVEEKRKNVREMLKADNTFLEKEGEHFDDVEWQPDWSKAPEWVTHFFCERDEDDLLNGYFCEGEGELCIDESIKGFNGYGRVISCPNFEYQGHWKDSLRKRP